MPALVNETVTLRWSGPPSGTAALAVVNPDGTTVTPAPTVTVGNPSTELSATLTPTQAGRHRVTWSRGGTFHTTILDVWPADPRYIIGIEDAMSALRITLPAEQTRQRDEVAVYVAAATWVIENISGPVLPVTKTYRCDGGAPAIVLPDHGVDVTEVTVDGTAVTLTTYDVDESAGIIYAPTTRGRLNVVVTYSVGSSTIDPNVRLATREEVRFLWQIGHQGARPVGPDASTEVIAWMPQGFAVPKRVIELLESRPRAGGFA